MAFARARPSPAPWLEPSSAAGREATPTRLGRGLPARKAQDEVPYAQPRRHSEHSSLIPGAARKTPAVAVVGSDQAMPSIAADARARSKSPCQHQRRHTVDGSSARPRSQSQGPVLSEVSVRRIWQRLDGKNTGSIQVKDIVANATFVKQECPRLLEQYERIAQGGVVKYQDVRRLLLGLITSSSGKSEARDSAQTMAEEELRSLFDRLKDAEGTIKMKALVDHREMVMATYPALIQTFETIDLDGNSQIAWEELKAFNGGTAGWLEHQLDGIVGLTELKNQVRSFYRSVVLDRSRRQLGHDVHGLAKSPHMIFQGNPGTGKTSLGRIMAKLLHRIGVTASPELREVQRPDLVGEHVGQTAPKTQAVIDGAKAGVLFIDEAYRLTSVEGGRDFGREAIETLMAAMNEPVGKAPVMIFAGYIRDMASFMRANEGLYRRISYTFDFADYSPGDLAHILESLTLGRGFQLQDTLLHSDRSELARLIQENTLPRSRALMNGGLCERIFDAAKQNLDSRDDPENPTVVLSAEDIQSACLAIPAPPEHREVQQQSVAAGKGQASELQPLITALDAVNLKEAMPPPASLFQADHAPRNVWFHLGSGEEFRGVTGCFRTSRGFRVSVRMDGKEVHCSALCRAPSFQETRIVPYNGESLLEFVILNHLKWGGAAVVGSTTLALKGLDFFDGALELRALDKPAGQLFVKVGWQLLAGVTGGDLLQACQNLP